MKNNNWVPYVEIILNVKWIILTIEDLISFKKKLKNEIRTRSFQNRSRTISISLHNINSTINSPVYNFNPRKLYY